MKLIPDCMRAVLLCIEEKQQALINEQGCPELEPLWLQDICSALEDWEATDIFYTLFILNDAGFISATFLDAEGQSSEFTVNYMTYDGHELLERVRDAERWSTVKRILGAARDYSLDAARSLAA